MHLVSQDAVLSVLGDEQHLVEEEGVPHRLRAEYSVDTTILTMK